MNKTASRIDVESRLEHARDVIRAAGKRAMDYYDGTAGDLEIEVKANALDMVSIADKNVEAIIRDRIADAFPEGSLVRKWALSRVKMTVFG